MSFLFAIKGFSQVDTVQFDSGDRLAGEVKGLDKAVLKMETAYSDDDFTANWEQVTYIWTTSRYMIILTNGDRFTGRIMTDPENPENIRVLQDNGQFFSTKHNNVVYLKSVKAGNWDRLSILIDGGFSLTKANDVKQYSLRGNISYNADRWNLDFNTSLINSTTQDSISADRRSYGLQFRYYVIKDMFVFGASDLLQSEEQDLDLRTNFVGGLGTAFIRNQDVALSVMVGGSYNNERYLTEGEENTTSGEGYLALEANLFGYSDFSLFSKVQTYPSFTDKDRIRLNLDFNMKYDLPLDFYISASTTFNYDSKPQTDAASSDYVVQGGVGWEF